MTLSVLLSWYRILHTLQVRYTLDMIYTYSGNILIAVSHAARGVAPVAGSLA